MKTKFILAIILSICSAALFAQGGFTNKNEATNQYKDSLKDGKWIEYRDSALKPTAKDNAIFYRLAIYTTGKENDTVRLYTAKDNTLKIITPYVNGKKEGISKWYFPDGVLGMITPMHNDSINGTQRLYAKNRKLRWELHFVNSKLEGISKKYYDNGKVELEIPYSDSLKNGIEKQYYDNGELKWECPYVNGKKNGIGKNYYETIAIDGNYQAWGIAWETPYVNDIINGSQIQYDIRGQVKSRTDYVNGQKKD